MDRRRTGSPVYTRQWSGSSTGSSSPAMSPAHPGARLPPSSGFSTVKRTQNFAAKAAAQRLAQVMASQAADEDDDDDDDLGFRKPASASESSFNRSSNGGPAVSIARPARSPSPAVILSKHYTTTPVCLRGIA